VGRGQVWIDLERASELALGGSRIAAHERVHALRHSPISRGGMLMALPPPRSPRDRQD
jgi:hypothetical protein